MKKLVFNAIKWNAAGGDVGDNSQFWEEAEIIRLYDSDDNEALADVLFPDGTISKGHFVSAMTDIHSLEERVAKLEAWSHEPQPVLSPQTFNRDMAMVYEALNDLRHRIQALEPE